MKRILILQNQVPHYRKSLYNELARSYEVTVLHSGRASVGPSDRYREIVVGVRRWGPFFLQSRVLAEVRRGMYDAVVAMFDVRWLMNIAAMRVHPPRTRFVWWGGWLGKNPVANLVKRRLARRGHPVLFYDREERQRFLDLGIPAKNLFVANNTYHVPHREACYLNETKTSVLFVGSFDARKQLDVLIAAFAAALPSIPRDIHLALVGEGSEGDRLKDLVANRDLGERVRFMGRVNDPAALTGFYREAIASVSFGQAGLSVLQSLAFGVPFLTKKNAISGGEKTNIIHGHNGLLCVDSQDALRDAIIKLCANVAWARALGKNAYDYYTDHCTIEIMADGFRAAIEEDS